MRFAPCIIAFLVAASFAPLAAAGAVTPENVDIKTRDRQTIHGAFYAPKSSKSLAPAALLVHGAGGSSSELDVVAQRLHKQGFAVLSLDLRGHGDSANADYDWSTCDKQSRETLWAFALKDLEAGADFLASDRRVHSSNLSLVGYEAGCTLATRYALRDENVRALALLDPSVQALGFDLQQDLADLGGLPTQIAVNASSKDEGTKLRASGIEANGGLQYIVLTVTRRSATTVLEDARLPTKIAKWLSDTAEPKRGR